MGLSEVVLHVPHSSQLVPTEVRRQICLDNSGLAQELLRMTDHFSDELFPSNECARVVFPVSRLVVDPERFEADAQEVMAQAGMGVVYTRTSDGRPLRREPVGPQERAALLAAYYLPHHERLHAAVAAALDRSGECLVIDCHSFPSRPLPYELDQNPERPDICLGTDEFHTTVDLLERTRAAFEAEGLTVATNRPFAGALVPMAFYRADARVTALMIEVNRRLYMDEATGEKLAAFDEVRKLLQRVLNVAGGFGPDDPE